MNLFKVFCIVAAGGLAGAAVGELVIVARDAKKMKEEYPDLKLLERLKYAAKDRVAKIKADPRTEIQAVWESITWSAMYVMGLFFGRKIGFKEGYSSGKYDGIGMGMDKLINAIIDACPAEFKKFISIIRKKGIDVIDVFEEDVTIDKQRYRRGYKWMPTEDAPGLANAMEG